MKNLLRAIEEVGLRKLPVDHVRVANDAEATVTQTGIEFSLCDTQTIRGTHFAARKTPEYAFRFTTHAVLEPKEGCQSAAHIIPKFSLTGQDIPFS